MKKIIYVLLIIFLSNSCKLKTVEEKLQRAKEKYTILIIDNCEYIMISEYRLGYMAHKGNCKNH